MNALVVGAGAVGQVIGHHLALGGARVSFLVKEKYAAELRRGLTLYPLNRRDRATPVRFAFGGDGYDVLSSPTEAGRAKWDQIYLAMSSTGLRAGTWLQELAPASATATMVSLFPGYEDGVYLARFVDPARTVAGMVGFISYHAPLPGESRFVTPGMAYWFPPLSASLFSGAEGVSAVVAALSGGGLPAKGVAGRGAGLVPGAIFTGFMPSLEAAGWSFASVRSGDWMGLASRAIREALAIGARELQARVPLARILIRPWLLRAALRVAPSLFPFDLETYVRVHFTKVGDQTRLALPSSIASGKKAGLKTVALEELVSRLPQ